MNEQYNEQNNEQNMEVKNSDNNNNNKKVVRILKLTNIFLVLLLVIFIAGIIYKFIFLYQKNSQQNNAKKATEQTLIADMQMLKNTNQKLAAQLEQQQLSIQEIQQNNAKIKALGQKINLLPLLETYHLVKTANLLLITEGDSKTAQELLTNAIKNIESIPSFAPIKQQIANNLKTLGDLSLVNKENTINKIDALIRTLETLTQFPEHITLTSKTVEQSAQNASLWQRFTSNIAKSTQNIIVIQHKTHEIPKLLNDQELTNLKQNIEFKLINAEWAIIHNQADLYKSCLLDAKLWFSTYYSPVLPEYKNIMQTLEDLEKININNTRIDITPTVEMISSVLLQQIHNAVPKQ